MMSQKYTFKIEINAYFLLYLVWFSSCIDVYAMQRKILHYKELKHVFLFI